MASGENSIILGALNYYVLYFLGDNQNSEWGIMVAPPHFPKCRFIMRYVRSVTSTIYGFGLLEAQGSPIDENCFCALWLTN